MMNNRRSIVAGVSAMLAAASASPALAAQVTETFDVAPGHWTLTSNSGAFPGFSNTDNTGGASGSGEAGGSFPLAWGHYADPTVGAIDFNQDLLVTGELSSVGGISNDPFIQFGYLNTANELSEAENFLGFRFVDQGSTQYRVSAIFNTSADTTTGNTNTSPLLILDQDLDYTFEFAYDADGGVASSGQLSLKIFDGSGQVGSTLLKDLTVAQRAEGISLNALGFRKVNGFAAEVYVDNLSYTAIPEPGTMALGTVAAMLMFLGRQWKR